MSDAVVPVGIKFTETMRGHLAPGDHEDYIQAEKTGKRLGDKLCFTVTIHIDDLAAFLHDDRHEARLSGTVEAPRFAGSVAIEDGRFNLFVEESGRKRMRYSMTFKDQYGSPHRLDGLKDVHNDPGFDIWSDTTTLFTRLYRLDPPQETAIGAGILRIRPIDLIPQLRSMRATNAANPAEGASALVSFGRFFFGRLWDEYKSSLRPPLPRRRRAAPDAEPAATD